MTAQAVFDPVEVHTVAVWPPTALVTSQQSIVSPELFEHPVDPVKCVNVSPVIVGVELDPFEDWYTKSRWPAVSAEPSVAVQVADPMLQCEDWNTAGADAPELAITVVFGKIVVFGSTVA